MQDRGVEKSLVMQGRSIGPAELERVRGLLAAHPDWSRYRLSCELCRVWNWRSLTGQIKDMAARTLLLSQRGQTVLLPKSCLVKNVWRCKIESCPGNCESNIPKGFIMVASSRCKPVQSHPLTRLIVAMICLLRSGLTVPRRFTRFAF